MNKTTKKANFNKTEYNMTYTKNHYEKITFQYKKDIELKSRLQTIAIAKNKPLNTIIVDILLDYIQKYDL